MAGFQIKIHQEEDGSYWAEVINLPGCFTSGKTTEELDKNLKEAISSYLLSLQDDLKGLDHFDFDLPKGLAYA